MKRIGLLGGTSWPSTINYYRILNKLAQQRLGGHHSAKLLLWNIDYHSIKSLYHHGWDQIPDLLRAEIIAFAKCQPDCLLICNNTLHEAYDLIADDLNLEIPVIHMLDCLAEFAKEEKHKNLLLLGTQYTMEHNYYSDRLTSYEFDITTPKQIQREKIQEIQTRLAKGEDPTIEDTKAMQSILSDYSSLDAVVLACTELPIVVSSKITNLEILDPVETQCKKAFEFAIRGCKK